MRSDLVDVSVKILHETAAAVKVTDTGDPKDAVWLPRSEIEIALERDGTVTVTLPEWLAQEKGLT